MRPDLNLGVGNSLKHEYNQMTATVHLSSQHALQQNGQSPRLVVPARRALTVKGADANF